MKKKKIGWKTILIVLLVFMLSLSLYRNYKLKQENELLSKGNVTLSDCRYCGGKVDLFTVNDSFYIQCRSCKIHTTYFRSKRDLVNYWNKN